VFLLCRSFGWTELCLISYHTILVHFLINKSSPIFFFFTTFSQQNYSQTASPTQKPSCGCPLCTTTVWNTPVTDSGGTYSCGSRITWLQTSNGGSLSERDACIRVSNEFPNGRCGPYCDPTKCNAGERKKSNNEVTFHIFSVSDLICFISFQYQHYDL